MNRSPIRVLFGSGPPSLISATIARLPKDLPLVVVSEFQPAGAEWVPFHIRRSLEDNRELLRSKLGDRDVQAVAGVLADSTQYRELRELAVSLAGKPVQWFDDSGETTVEVHERRMRRRALKAKAANARRLLRPRELRLSMLYRKALRRGQTISERPRWAAKPLGPPKTDGISVVIPSRNGRDLLAQCLPALAGADEVIVVDNGSTDGTVDWLASEFPAVIVEHSPPPLAFAVAMNRGFERARFRFVCALNNDMVVEPGFLAALRRAFEEVPNLFCATAQIFFSGGQRREETGKTAMTLDPPVLELPVRCDVPLDGEDLSYVPYGSGGCSLYDAAKLAAIGGFDEAYAPAYFEDFDLGLRGWSQGWPSVYCAHARVLHRHRATTSRYFSKEQLELTLETNYLRFLVRAFHDRSLFGRMWNHAVLRLKAMSKADALQIASTQEPAPALEVSEQLFALFGGSVAVFSGRARSANPRILIASPYLPFPLSHGAAVRIFNLIRETANQFDIILLAYVEEPRPVPVELLDLCVEVITVHRKGSHALPSRGRPDTVEEFDTLEFRGSLVQTIAKWSPEIVQFEFTQMAVYARDCRVPTILVEHDITYDLYAQMLTRPETNDWETRRQHDLWKTFELQAWKDVTRVVTMSDKDRGVVGGPAVTIGNGVDLNRFQPSDDPPAARRLLFIGSFAHRPNVLALEFFLREVFPLLSGVTLHVIAGQNHTRFWDLRHENVEVEGFVSDVRPAYRAATVVIAPLVASAGTNVKIVEAMAMGKAIVSTEAGIHGLELERGADVLVSDDPKTLAEMIGRLHESPEERRRLEQHARATAERIYGWPAMARVQAALYRELLELSRKDRVV